MSRSRGHRTRTTVPERLKAHIQLAFDQVEDPNTPPKLKAAAQGLVNSFTAFIRHVYRDSPALIPEWAQDDKHTHLNS